MGTLSTRWQEWGPLAAAEDTAARSQPATRYRRGGVVQGFRVGHLKRVDASKVLTPSPVSPFTSPVSFSSNVPLPL